MAHSSARSLKGVPPVTDEELRQMHGGIIGLIKNFAVEGDGLGIDLRQVGIFCRNTPGGKKGLELWQEYAERRDKWGGEANYDFADFIREILETAGYPLKSPKSSAAFRITRRNKK